MLINDASTDMCYKLVTTYPVSASDDDDLKSSIINSVKTFDVTLRIGCFLLKKEDL